MADYTKQVKAVLSANGCTFRRRGKGDHDIWYSPHTNNIVVVDSQIRKRHTANGVLKQAGIKHKLWDNVFSHGGGIMTKCEKLSTNFAEVHVSDLRRDFPILEFDADRDAFIRPDRIIEPIYISERAVICFFADANERFISRHPHKIVAYMKPEGLTIPVYEVEYKGERVVLVQAIVGAPMAAGHIEELVAYGCRKFIACGGCGVLEKDIAVGHLIIPTTAIRDEGTSYHYAPPSREIAMSEHAIQAIESTLAKENVPYVKAKTWTTDAFFRETNGKIQLRKEEGCLAVEMETSAFIAVAKYNNVEFGQILYAGDSLAGDSWDGRKWTERSDIRDSVLRMAFDSCLNL